MKYSLNQFDSKEKAFPFRDSYLKQHVTHQDMSYIIPSHYSSQQEHEKQSTALSIPTPLSSALYSVATDPRPFHSPWFIRSTSPFQFQFSQCQEQIVANAQKNITQSTNLTKMFCDEASVFTPITPRLKLNCQYHIY